MVDRSAPTFHVRCLPDGPGGAAPRIDDLSARILSLKYDDEEQRADRLVLSVDNDDLQLFDDPAFRKGMPLEVSWGYPGAMAPARECVVTKITGGRTLNVEARARSLLLNRQTRVRTFTNVRRSEVAQQLAREAGYGDELQDVEDTVIVYPTIAQARLTDALFLVRLARLEGFEFWIDQDGFHWHRRRVDQAPAKVFRYFTSRTGEILDFNVENDITARPGRTRVRGRNPIERTDIDEVADDSTDADRPTLAPIRDIIDFETLETRTVVDENAAQEEVRTTAAPDAATAQREARGRFRRIQQTAVKMSLDLVGDASVLAKTVVEVQGLGQRLSGRYYVKKVSHQLNTGGYSMKASIVSDGHGGHSTESRVARGLELLDPGPQTRGRPNAAEPQPGASPAAGPTGDEGAPLQAVDVINPETQQTETVYRDSRGRQQGGGST